MISLGSRTPLVHRLIVDFRHPSLEPPQSVIELKNSPRHPPKSRLLIRKKPLNGLCSCLKPPPRLVFFRRLQIEHILPQPLSQLCTLSGLLRHHVE